jgi:hypothetical protein
LIPDNAILDALEMKPFASIPRIAQMNFIPPTAVFRGLTKPLHFVLQRLRLVPHRRSDLQKRPEVIMSKELLKLLESMRHHSWKYLKTLAETWFDLSIFLSFYLFIFLLITNQFGSVQKMKLYKGRVISEDDFDSRRELAQISLD